MPPKILVLIHGLSRTGVPRITLDIFTKLSEHCNIETISLLDGLMRDDFERLGPIRVLWPGGTLANRASGLLQRLLVTLKLRLNTNKYDLVYVASAAVIPVIHRIKLPNVPVILHVHEMGDVLIRIMETHNGELTLLPTRYIAASNAVAETLKGQCGIHSSKISLIHEFVSEELLELQVSSKPATEKSTFVVGGAGFPFWCKGTTLWLLMAAELRRLVGENVRFMWVGASEEQAYRSFRNEARLLGLEGSVEFIPPTKTPLEYFAKFDAFAMTSWEDSCPLVLLENMALGKPSLCFAQGGGAREVIADAGIVVDGFRPEVMARKIAELIANPSLCTTLGASAKQRVAEGFTNATQLPKILNEIHLCLSEKHVNERVQ